MVAAASVAAERGAGATVIDAEVAVDVASCPGSSPFVFMMRGYGDF